MLCNLTLLDNGYLFWKPITSFRTDNRTNQLPGSHLTSLVM